MRALTSYEFSLVSGGCGATEKTDSYDLLVFPAIFGSIGAVAGSLVGAANYGALGAIAGIPVGALTLGVGLPIVMLTGAVIASYPYVYAANYFANSDTGS